MRDIYKLEPLFRDYIWGGEHLVKEYGYSTDLDKVAEVWLLSGHNVESNYIKSVDLDLNTIISKHGKEFLGSKCPTLDYLPLLIKFIDANDKLSIQVHPNDRYANTCGDPFGKTEMWYIVDTKEDNNIIYGTTEDLDKEMLREKLENNTLIDSLSRAPIEKSDTVLIEAGVIHAINAGTVVFEVQQSSDTTYRIYDYDRVDKNGSKRELHVEEALAVSNGVPLEKNFSTKSFRNGKDIITPLQDHDMFKVTKIKTEGYFKIQTNSETFMSLIILEGEGEIQLLDSTHKFKKGESYILPAKSNICEVIGKAEFVITTL